MRLTPVRGAGSQVSAWLVLLWLKSIMCVWRCLGQCLGYGPGMAGWEHCLYKSRLGFSWTLKSNLVQDFSEVYSAFGIHCLVLACFFSFLVCLTNQEVVVKGLQTCLGVPATFAVLPSGLADCILPVSREQAGFKESSSTRSP